MSGRLRSFRATVALTVALALGGCLYIPERIASLPADGPWLALPLRAFLSEARGEPEAIAACFDASCPHRLAVGVFLLQGRSVREAEAVLRNPDLLAKQIAARDRADTAEKRKQVRTVVTTRRLAEGGRDGFLVTLANEADPSRLAAGAAFGIRAEGGLRVVLAVGDDAAAVEGAARQAAAEVLGR